jgi:hypothetical protein
MIWHTPKTALNSSDVSSLSFSTRPLRAQGRTPPNPESPILLKQRKICKGVIFFKKDLFFRMNYFGTKGRGIGF